MNNAVDYLEFEIQSYARGHIRIPFQPPVITLIVILLSSSTQELIDVNFVTAVSGWEYDCASARQSSWHERKKVKTHSLFRSTGINSLSTLFAVAYSVSSEKLSHCYLLCFLIKTLKCVWPLHQTWRYYARFHLSIFPFIKKLCL